MGETDREKLTYKAAGVDIDAAAEATRHIGELVRSTFNSNVLRDIGTFGAMYRLDEPADSEPVLVSSVDGVGTKLKVAFMTGRHDTVGIDLVAHCVNDILVQAARPLFFLDYFATSNLDPDVAESVVSGLVEGCKRAGCALIGGEIAELPGFYNEGEYDLAGCIVGVVSRDKIVDGSTVEKGDAIVGLASSGLHTNGYSLARRIVFDVCRMQPDDVIDGCGRSAADELLEPHRCYAQPVQPLLGERSVRGMAHITGGGITDNLPRSLPKGLGARIERGRWRVPPIFEFLQQKGNVDESEMYRTFNMGVGYILVVPAEESDRVCAGLKSCDVDARVIGAVTDEWEGVRYV